MGLGSVTDSVGDAIAPSCRRRLVGPVWAAVPGFPAGRVAGTSIASREDTRRRRSTSLCGDRRRADRGDRWYVAPALG